MPVCYPLVISIQNYRFSNCHIQINETGYSCRSCFLQFLTFLADKGPNTPDSMCVTNIIGFLIQIHLCHSVFNHSHQEPYYLVFSPFSAAKYIPFLFDDEGRNMDNLDF